MRWTPGALIAQLERREAALLDEIEKAEQVREALSEAYKAALIEIESLRATMEHQKAALAEREKQVERVTSERDEARTEAKSLRRENRLMKIGIVAITLIRLIKLGELR